MTHQLDGFELKFTSRRSWKAERRHNGKLLDIVPVTWSKDLHRDGKQKFLLVHFTNTDESEKYRTQQKSYIVAVAEAKDYSAEKLSFSKFTALYEVVSTGKKLNDHSIETRIIGRVGAENNESSASQKITRISYNSNNWQKPTGEARDLEIGGTYNQDHGFGHEDWLFRNEWTIAGWRYAFLQGVNKSTKKLVQDGKPVDITLFTIQPDKRRRYVARIREMECLSDEQAEAALVEFRKKGWLDAMRKEIKDVGGNPEALGNDQRAQHILNVRFRLENIYNFPTEAFANTSDPIRHYNRYQIYDLSVQPVDNSDKPKTRSGSEEPPDPRSHLRSASGKIQVSPEHAKMQKQLMEDLRKQFPNARIVREENFIDVLVETETDLYLYEIKSDLSPMAVLRAAIGQLLEYAFRMKNAQKCIHLIAVGRTPLCAVDENYLKHLQRDYALPLEYFVVRI